MALGTRPLGEAAAAVPILEPPRNTLVLMEVVLMEVVLTEVELMEVVSKQWEEVPASLQVFLPWFLVQATRD